MRPVYLNGVGGGKVPTYGYECTRCGAEFEVLQRITEEPLTEHSGCGGAVRRRVFPVGIVFKGPGFHVNDYAPKGNGKDASRDKPAETKAEPSSSSGTTDASSVKSETTTAEAAAT
jgi:putative FmdB family regulatory protein